MPPAASSRRRLCRPRAARRARTAAHVHATAKLRDITRRQQAARCRRRRRHGRCRPMRRASQHCAACEGRRSLATQRRPREGRRHGRPRTACRTQATTANTQQTGARWPRLVLVCAAPPPVEGPRRSGSDSLLRARGQLGLCSKTPQKTGQHGASEIGSGSGGSMRASCASRRHPIRRGAEHEEGGLQGSRARDQGRRLPWPASAGTRSSDLGVTRSGLPPALHGTRRVAPLRGRADRGVACARGGPCYSGLRGLSTAGSRSHPHC